MKKIVLFGAGKIGRSFIGQVFSRGGYEVVFVDIFQPVIDALNKEKKYKVIVKSNEGDATMWVENVRGVMGTDAQQVANEVATADILAVSVGQRGLPHILPNIAKGLTIRYQQNPQLPLDIIIAENMRDADKFCKQILMENLPSDYPFNQLVGLVETSIGKMVPIMSDKDMSDDILQVFSEAYNNLVLDKKGFKNTIPTIPDLAPKEHMKAWVDRKLFIHNLGHATTAYIGYKSNPSLKHIYEVLEDKHLKEQIKKTMLQAGDILLTMYPDEFTSLQIINHVDDLLQRFENKALGDTIFRVGCDLQRKLSQEDRLFGAIHKGIELKIPVHLIIHAAMAGFAFKATDEHSKLINSDIEFFQLLNDKGAAFVLENICGLKKEAHPEIFNECLNELKG